MWEVSHRHERQRFIEKARLAPVRVRLFCLMLRWSCARISEVLALTPAAIDIESGVASILTLKRRKRVVTRASHRLIRRPFARAQAAS